MFARLVIIVLLLCASLVVPLATEAGECHAVVVFFESKKDILSIINLDGVENPVGTSQLRVAFWLNNGAFVADLAGPIFFTTARLVITAADLYGPPSAAPPITDSFVRIQLVSVAGGPFGPPPSGPRPFSATVTQNGVTRELGCVTPL